MLLEQAAEGSATREYPFDLTADGERLTIDTRPLIKAIVKDLLQGRPAGHVAGRFHRTVAASVAALCRVIKMQTNIHRVCLAGGVFANDLLVSDVGARLTSHGFEVFVPRQAPAGDGGLSLGQVLVAHARLTEGVV
jgi:hydrogenase maturation protein HypF